jgi:low affinity Fe/Cu permease
MRPAGAVVFAVARSGTRRLTRTLQTAPEDQQMAQRQSKRGNDQQSAKKSVLTEFFTQFAFATAHWSGKPVTFITAVLLVGIWAATGPAFGYSDTWQLVINTSTTIITFLMVFLIQNTQNRDTLALQIKLAELIHAVRGAKNQMATVEDLSEDELEQLHAEYRQLADSALDSLQRRRSGRGKGR